MASRIAHSRDRVRLAALATVGLVLLSACGRAPSAGVPTPTPSTPIAQPSPAIKPPMLPLPALEYDPASRKLMLVGGLSQSGPEVWLWDRRGWQYSPPVPRSSDVSYGSAMAYDTSRKRMVLVIPPGAGTWLWDEVNWNKSESMPRLFAEPEVAYDSKDGAVVAIALSDAVAGPHPDSVVPLETPDHYWGVSLWTWDGAVWHGSKTSLFRRYRSAVAYDQARGELVVFGGPDPQVPMMDPDPTTWLWNGATWRGVTTDIHPPPGQSAAAYDPLRKEVVLVVAGETWTWDGRAWAKRATTGPGTRQDHRMAYDEAIGEVVLFGGRATVEHGMSDLNDLWGWDGANWLQLG